MWKHLTTALTENEASFRQTKNRVMMLTAGSLIATFAIALWSLSSFEVHILEKPLYNPRETNFELLGTSQPNAFLFRILIDWIFFASGLCVFIGGLYNYTLGKPLSYLTFSMAFLVIAVGSIFHSLSISNLIYSGESPKTHLVFAWFMLRFLAFVGVSIGALFSLKSCKAAFWGGLIAFTLLLVGFAYYNLFSPLAFRLLFGKNLLTRTLFYLPLVGWVGLALPLSFWYFKRSPSFFSYALLLCLIPQITLDLCVIMRKTVIFYSGFNAIHLLEVLFLLIPFVGMTWDHFGFYQKLQSEKLKVTRATESKLFFLSTIAEDVQFSTAELTSYTESLKEQQNVENQQATYKIKEAARKVETVIKNLLSLSAFEKGHIVMDKSEVDLGNLLKQALKLHGVENAFEGKEELKISTDPKRTLQVFSNAFSLFKGSPFTAYCNTQEVIFEGHESKWSEGDLREISTPLLQKQTDHSTLLKYQLLVDLSKKIMEELEGSWTLEWNKETLKVILKFPETNMSKV